VRGNVKGTDRDSHRVRDGVRDRVRGSYTCVSSLQDLRTITVAEYVGLNK
jgi:hypothetical protein